MSTINRSLEQSRLEIMILAIGVLVLVSLLGLVVFINLRFKPHYERKGPKNDYTHNENASLADNAKRELASLRRRVTMSASVDASAGGQDTHVRPEQRRFKLVPSTDKRSTTINTSSFQEPVQDDGEKETTAIGNDVGHDGAGQ